MEQKSQQLTAVIAIKEEVTDTNSLAKENTVTSHRVAKTSKGSNKETNNSLDCPAKVERNVTPPLGTSSRNDSSPKSATTSQSPITLSAGSVSSKNTIANAASANTNSVGSLSPPLAQPLLISNNNSTSDLEYTSVASKTSSKVKRLLSTLLQFAGTLNSDVGESVKTLIFNLACNTISIEEFHSNLQEVTNFPLRPFVLPFLKNYIPVLQKEIHLQAKLTKQNVQQYVRLHENCVLDPFCSSAELSDVFSQMDAVSSSNQSEILSSILMGKRRYECHENIVCHKADSPTDSQIHQTPPMKKQVPLSVFTNMNGLSSSTTNQQPSYYPIDYFQIPPPPFISAGNNWSPSASISSSKDFNSSSDDRKNAGNSEWNNIYVMLNCILSMVEKTKRALAILQERNTQEMNGGDDGINTNGVGGNGDHGSSARRTAAEEVKRTANELMAHTVRVTEEKVAFVRRKAEEAVNEVKKQAILELQKAIASTDYKGAECGSTKNGSKLCSDSKKPFLSNSDPEFTGQNGYQLSERLDSSNIFSQTLQSTNCWNCGRKAQETCSGCNLARYCGAFCQHKDWENHHQICNGYVNSALINLEKTIPSRPPPYVDPFLTRVHAFGELVGKSGSSVDLSNMIRSQSAASELCRLLPFSINMAAISPEKATIGRSANSRPATPVATQTANVNSSSSKVKK